MNTGVRRHRLLGESCGLESIGSLLMLVQVDDLAVSHLEVYVEAKVNLDSTSPTATDQVHGRHHIVVSSIEHLLDVHAVLGPRVEPAVPDPHGTVEAVGGCVVVLNGH